MNLQPRKLADHEFGGMPSDSAFPGPLRLAARAAGAAGRGIGRVAHWVNDTVGPSAVTREMGNLGVSPKWAKRIGNASLAAEFVNPLSYMTHLPTTSALITGGAKLAGVAQRMLRRNRVQQQAVPQQEFSMNHEQSLDDIISGLGNESGGGGDEPLMVAPSTPEELMRLRATTRIGRGVRSLYDMDPESISNMLRTRRPLGGALKPQKRARIELGTDSGIQRPRAQQIVSETKVPQQDPGETAADRRRRMSGRDLGSFAENAAARHVFDDRLPDWMPRMSDARRQGTGTSGFAPRTSISDVSAGDIRGTGVPRGGGVDLSKIQSGRIRMGRIGPIRPSINPARLADQLNMSSGTSVRRQPGRGLVVDPSADATSSTGGDGLDYTDQPLDFAPQNPTRRDLLRRQLTARDFGIAQPSALAPTPPRLPDQPRLGTQVDDAMLERLRQRRPGLRRLLGLRGLISRNRAVQLAGQRGSLDRLANSGVGIGPRTRRFAEVA